MGVGIVVSQVQKITDSLSFDLILIHKFKSGTFTASLIVSEEVKGTHFLRPTQLPSFHYLNFRVFEFIRCLVYAIFFN